MLPIEQLQQLQSKVSTSELGQRFINHHLLKKDIWSLEELGLSKEALAILTSKNLYFKKISLPWLKLLVKLTILVLSFETDSISSIIQKYTYLKLFDKFLVKN